MQTRTTLLVKDDMIAIIAVLLGGSCGMLAHRDPRDAEVVFSHQDSPEIAMVNYRNGAASSRVNGWKVFYEGPPNFG